MRHIGYFLKMANICGRLSTGLLFCHRINSPLCRTLQEVKYIPTAKDQCVTILRRGMAGGKAPKFFIKAPDYSERSKLRKMFKYLAYTGVPALGFVTCVNVFIGPAQLAEIPEGYEPKHWEYFQHPITRFIVRHFHASQQQEYEKMAHFLEKKSQQRDARRELVAVKKLMKERKDGYYSYVAAVPPTETIYEDKQE